MADTADPKGFEEKDDTRGVCFRCGEWDCQEHKTETAPEGYAGAAGLNPTFIMLGSEILEKLEKMFNEAKAKGEEFDAVISSGKADQIEKASEDEEKEFLEKAKEEEDGLPISMVGFKMKAITHQDIEGKPSAKDLYPHVEFLRTTEVVTTEGAMRTVSEYRMRRNVEKTKPIAKVASFFVPQFKRQMMMALEAEARISRERGLKRGSIDAGRVSRLISDGRTDVFSKKANRKSMNVAVSIVTDDSGSMIGSIGYGATVTKRTGMSSDEFLRSKGGTQMVMAYIMGEVMNSFPQVKTEIVSYHGGFGMMAGGHYSCTYKTFAEQWTAVKDRIGSYEALGNHDYPYEAAMYAAARLYKQSADLRVMFFLTDASPGNRGIEKMGKLAKEFKAKYDIRMVGVGIGDNYLKEIMKDGAEVIENQDGMNEQIFKRMAKIIRPF